MGTHARGVVWAWGLVLFAWVVNPRTEAATWFVKTNGSDAAAGTNWATAKQTIQAAVDAAAASDTVLVSNGVYQTGGRVAPGFALTNRVFIDKPLTVHSINGPAFTTIRGRGPLGHAAMHCVWMTNGATVASFNPTPDRGAAALAASNDYGKETYEACHDVECSAVIRHHQPGGGVPVFQLCGREQQ